MASRRTSSASLLSCTFGAKPPSSPTLQASWPYFFLMTPFNVWYTSAPISMAFLKEVAPVGRIMNSWHAKRLPAWLPPLMTLKEGTGITNLSVGLPASFAMYWYNGISLAAAPARHTAMETARMALAPSFALDQPHSFLEPSSSSTMTLSIFVCWVTSMPMSLGAMMSLTFATAFSTPLPSRRPLSPSRSSRASYTPVEAPLGTAARKSAVSVQRSTSTVGLPRESKISRARMAMIFMEAGASSRAATPGSTLPSRSSREAPPPVLQCVTLSSVSYFLHAVAVSPPPITVMVPDLVTSTTLSIMDFVPASKLFISNTPIGPFHTIVLDLAMAAAFLAMDSGPQSSPMKPAGTPPARVADLISPPSPNSEEQTKSTGNTISTPLALALSMISCTILEPSSSKRDLPMSVPLITLMKVKAMPPPMIMMSTLSRRFLMS
mmetsp:Transcript_33191/g.99991  ORF Transcript_33191/g.99991 Transcript_33191/m.99991 type:complete len:436 (+) Transcript_33191:828-2135(+)